MFDTDKWHKEISARDHSTEHKEKNTMLDRSTPQWKAKEKWRKEFSEKIQEKFIEYKYKKENGIPIDMTMPGDGKPTIKKLANLPSSMRKKRNTMKRR